MDTASAPTILVVDDNAENRALAQATLEDEGYVVILANNGEEAIAAVQREQPDCLLLDVRMPGMDGLTACARIRALPGHSHTPIVFLTALRDVDTFDRALRAGGDDFLTKPVRPSELLIRVSAALKLRRLSGELRELYELVRRQRDDLTRLQLQKERLMAFVVHDIKNPVSTIDLHAQMMLMDRGLADEHRGAARAMRSEVRSILRLLLNLLDISKSEEGQLAPSAQQIDLQELLTEVREAHEINAKNVGASLRCIVDAPHVVADRDLLRRVIENLVDNAIRHAPEGSEVRIATAVGAGMIEIHVIDAGIGVPEDMREKIFEPFVQVDAGERVVARTGRGLGLTFCKLAVVAHGGSIAIEDAQPGTIFRVRIPHVG
jgi:two-component system sensor histidine kinase/response regulator